MGTENIVKSYCGIFVIEGICFMNAVIKRLLLMFGFKYEHSEKSNI